MNTPLRTESEIEDAILAAVASSLGISTRQLIPMVRGRRAEIVLRTIEGLVVQGRLDRRTEERTVNGRRATVAAFYVPFPATKAGLREESSMVAGENPARGASTDETLAPPSMPADPSICPACGAGRRHLEHSPECLRIAELREWGETHGWPRVPLASGTSIQAGAMFWPRWLDIATVPMLVEAARQIRNLGYILAGARTT